MTDDALDNLLHEDRRFPPPADLAANANVTAETYAEAEADFEGFWAKQAKRLSWQIEPTQVLDWSNPPFAKWYADGTLNAAYNCLDRHVEAGNGDRVAFYFEGEPGDTQVITYAELTRQVKRHRDKRRGRRKVGTESIRTSPPGDDLGGGAAAAL